MKIRLAILSLIVALVSVSVVAPVRANAAGNTPGSALSIPVQVPLTGSLAGDTLNGVLNITHFGTNSAGQLTASGSLVYSVVDSLGNVVNGLSGITQTLTNIPLTTGSGGTCSILDLTVGAIHLDLLGLTIDTNTIHLSITAQSGPGNLLGNLLCSVAHLLDNGNTNAVANILNAVTRLLQGVQL